MANEIANTAPTAPEALVWTTKSGIGRRAASETLKALAPKNARMGNAGKTDLFLMQHGTFGPMLEDVKSQMSKSSLKSLRDFGLFPEEGEAITKALAVQIFEHLAKKWASQGGKKQALAATMQLYIDWVAAKPAPKAPALTVDLAEMLKD